MNTAQPAGLVGGRRAAWARSRGRLLIDQLARRGADTICGIPGESFLAALDGLRDVIRFVNARHEGGSAMMADAYGKLTGRPGTSFVTRRPRATSASTGIHVAHRDSTPLILLIGQVGRDMVEREEFQEIVARALPGRRKPRGCRVRAALVASPSQPTVQSRVLVAPTAANLHSSVQGCRGQTLTSRIGNFREEKQ